MAYSCHSLSHNTFIRIDLFFGFLDCLPLVSDISFFSRVISGHSLLQLVLDFDSGGSHAPLSPFSLWLDKQEVHDLTTIEAVVYWEVNTGTATKPIIWEAFNALSRGYVSISISECREPLQNLWRRDYKLLLVKWRFFYS